jgi:hypothetical protein
MSVTRKRGGGGGCTDDILGYEAFACDSKGKLVGRPIERQVKVRDGDILCPIPTCRKSRGGKDVDGSDSGQESPADNSSVYQKSIHPANAERRCTRGLKKLEEQGQERGNPATAR